MILSYYSCLHTATLAQLKAHLIVLCFARFFFCRWLYSFSAAGTKEGAGRGGVGQNSAVVVVPVLFIPLLIFPLWIGMA